MMEKIEAMTEDDAGCMVWLGGCSNGHPCMRVGKDTKLVRRLAYEATNGAIPAGRVIRMNCGSPKCVNPEHMTATTYRQIGKEIGAMGGMSGIKRSAAIARAKRASKQSKLTDEQVMDIRLSDDKLDIIAARHGVSQGYVWRIRAGIARRDFTNPFLGLAGGAA
jgi:hypothetical protein